MKQDKSPLHNESKHSYVYPNNKYKSNTKIRLCHVLSLFQHYSPRNRKIFLKHEFPDAHKTFLLA